MANTTFDGPVRSKNGFINLGPSAVKAELLAVDLTVADHAGRLVTMDPTGTPTAITIPAINANADGASAGTIKTANTADKFVGAATVGIDASVAGKQFVAATGDNEVNLNGEAGASNATTGGLKGSRIKFTAIAANLYAVEGQLLGNGSIATPFDAQ